MEESFRDSQDDVELVRRYPVLLRFFLFSIHFQDKLRMVDGESVIERP